MVLRHASEKFRLAYELPLESYELFGSHHQFANVTLESLDEKSYQSDLLAKYDLWKKKDRQELIDYQTLDETFYDQEIDDEEVPDYGDAGDDETASKSPFLYQWHRDQHYDVENFITKYVDDKMSVKIFFER